ncbi:MAG: hypothetical protein ACREIR_24190, partial [Geminicoccaceae bacterium]
MADARGRLSGGHRLVEHRLLRLEIQAGVRDLAAVGDLDATEAMLSGELDATFQVAMRGDHASACIFGITEATERLRLELGRADLACELETSPVLDEA